MDFHLLSIRDLGFDGVGAGVEFAADLVGAQFRLDCAGVKRSFIADGKDADLLGRQPEREVTGVMFDEEPDETFVGAERGAMDGERDRAALLLRLDKQGRLSRERFVPRLCAMVASFPRELAWIFYPLLAARISLEKDRHFLSGKLAPIHSRISFGDAVTF
jgi:hypothetical protein